MLRGVENEKQKPKNDSGVGRKQLREAEFQRSGGVWGVAAHPERKKKKTLWSLTKTTQEDLKKTETHTGKRG